MLAIPSSTAAQVVAPAAAKRESHGAGLREEPRVDRWIDRLTAHPRRVQAVLDAAALGFGLLLLTESAAPEILFHAIFVVLTLNAFLFGLRGTLWRIGAVSIALVGYEEAPAFGLDLAPMDLAEWPLMFVIALLVALMADRRQTTASHYAALFRRATERLVTVQDDERRRIARDLHDGVGQTLTALTLTLDSAVGQTSDDTAAARIASARRLAEDALDESRDVANRLRPIRLEQVGLVGAIRDLASRAGFPVVVEANLGAAAPELLSPAATAEVFRIVQEALANSAHHSGAVSARISVSADRDLLRLSMSDDGIGFDPTHARGRGLGLPGMQERAAALGGRLSVDSAMGRGTRIVVELPRDGIAAMR